LPWVEIINIMRRFIKIVVAILILSLFSGIAYYIVKSAPEQKRRSSKPAPVLTVKTKTLTPQPYQVILNSYGTVRPRTSGNLMTQISGKIELVSDQFRAGAFVEKGELLVRIEKKDYEADVKVAKAELVSAQQLVSEEQARANQALEDWKRLRRKESPSALVLREPQLQSAQARLASAQAALAKAKLNLDRTRITAPYTGRIININVDIGQVVSPSTVLAEVYAVDFLEVRLPLRNQDLRFITLPERTRHSQDKQTTQPLPQVTLTSSLVSNEKWPAQIVRTEGAIDEQSRQLTVIAQINDPYGVSAEGKQPLKIGEYVTAEIIGKNLNDVIIVPNHIIYQGSYTYVVENDRLLRREIEIGWQNDTNAIIEKGLVAGDKLVITTLGQVPSGTKVKLASATDKRQNNKIPKTKPKNNEPAS